MKKAFFASFFSPQKKQVAVKAKPLKQCRLHFHCEARNAHQKRSPFFHFLFSLRKDALQFKKKEIAPRRGLHDQHKPQAGGDLSNHDGAAEKISIGSTYFYGQSIDRDQHQRDDNCACHSRGDSR